MKNNRVACTMQVTPCRIGRHETENESSESSPFSLRRGMHARSHRRQVVVAGDSRPAPGNRDLWGTTEFTRAHSNKHPRRPLEKIGGSGTRLQVRISRTSGALLVRADEKGRGSEGCSPGNRSMG